MRKSFAFIVLLVSPLAAQTPAAVSPNTVVATINGRKFTAEQIEKMVAGTPSQVQEAYKRNPKQFMQDYAYYLHLQDMAEKQGIDKKSPYKEVLEFQRLLTLVNAALTEKNYQIAISPDEQRKHYDTHIDRYREVQAKLIYIPFSAPQLTAAASGDKKPLTEVEAKARAEEVTKKARAGADFVKLVQEYSEDPASRKQNGDIGLPIRSTTMQVPAAMREAVLKLKQGEISDPVRNENGYYIFRAESSGVLPYDKVKDEIFKELKEAGFQQWQQKTKTEVTVQFDNESFFQSKPK